MLSSKLQWYGLFIHVSCFFMQLLQCRHETLQMDMGYAVVHCMICALAEHPAESHAGITLHRLQGEILHHLNEIL